VIYYSVTSLLNDNNNNNYKLHYDGERVETDEEFRNTL